MSEITSRPYQPKMACEACVFMRGMHAEWCPWLSLSSKDECACGHERDRHSSWWLGPIDTDDPEPEYCYTSDENGGDCRCTGFRLQDPEEWAERCAVAAGLKERG